MTQQAGQWKQGKLRRPCAPAASPAGAPPPRTAQIGAHRSVGLPAPPPPPGCRTAAARIAGSPGLRRRCRGGRLHTRTPWNKKKRNLNNLGEKASNFLWADRSSARSCLCTSMRRHKACRTPPLLIPTPLPPAVQGVSWSSDQPPSMDGMSGRSVRASGPALVVVQTQAKHTSHVKTQRMCLSVQQPRRGGAAVSWPMGLPSAAQAAVVTTA